MPTTDARAAALRALRRAHRAHDEPAALLAVAQARQLDVTWREIGETVGMNRHNACRKWLPHLIIGPRTVTVRPADSDPPG